MATATLTITDINLDTGEVQIEAGVEGSMIDDGHMTAAEVMIRVLHKEVNSPAFRQRLWAEIANMTKDREGVEIANDDQAPVEALEGIGG